MELNRLIRVLRDRWFFVVVLSLIGLVSAWGMTGIANRNRESLFQATAPFRLEPEEGETVADLSDDLEEARQVASIAAADQLLAQPGSSILVDATTARILFIATGGSIEEARERAESLINAYLDFDPSTFGAVDELLDQLDTEAVQLERQLADLQPMLAPEEQELANRHDLLDLQIEAVRQRIVALTVADAAATTEQQELNAIERDRLETTLEQLMAEKASLPPRPSLEPTITQRFQLNAIQRRLDLLNLEYERLFLRKLGVTSVGLAEPVIFTDLTPPPANPLVNGAVGLFGGLGLALFALLFVTRTRKPIWLPEDVPVPLLGEVPGRKITTAPGPAWYDEQRGGARKAAIQALRTAVEGRLVQAPASFVIAGHGGGSVWTHALAVDLAAAFASAGWSVLLVDADFDAPAQMTEYKVAGLNLASVLALRGEGTGLRGEVSSALDGAVYIREDLAVVPAGRSPSSPADAVAGRQFRSFLEEALGRFDIVVVVAGEADSPAAQVLMQRLGSGLLTLLPGRSTIPQVNGLLHDLSQRRVAILGAVFLQRSERPLTMARPAPPPVLQPSYSPMGRLQSYPFPGGRASGLLPKNTLRGLAQRIGPERRVPTPPESSTGEASHPDRLGAEVLDALSSSGVAAYESVAEYVTSRVEDMVTAVPGQGNLSEDLLAAVARTAFIPLRSLRGLPSVGERLEAELRDEVGAELGNQISKEIVRILGEGSGRPGQSLDDWLVDEFFRRHVERTEREPMVWHLTSELGTVQVLVNSQRLTRERLDLLSTEVVRRVIDQLQRNLKTARTRGQETAAIAIEGQLKDAHLFEIALGWLIGGSSDQARIVYPWKRGDQQPSGWDPVWSEGVRPNLAPLQRLGLLPYPVLTEEEMESLLPTG